MTQRERQYQPDYGIEPPPYEGGPWPVAALVWVWTRRGCIGIVFAFAAGYFGRRLGFF